MLTNDFVCPKEWYDKDWLDDRQELLTYLSEDRRQYSIDFRSCQWLDLHPLADLLLQIGTTSKDEKPVQLVFRTPRNPTANRVLLFLQNTGFFTALRDDLGTQSKLITVVLDGQELDIDNALKAMQGRVQPTSLLNYDPIIRCTFCDARRFDGRLEVFQFCRQLRRDALAADRARALGMPVPLIQQAKILFNAILPEIIDNVRIHKHTSANSYFAMFIRIRRGGRLAPGARTYAEPTKKLTFLKQKTTRFWQDDILEAVVSDNGKTIQETWLDAWRDKEENRKKIVPRLRTKEGNIRLDGDNKDAILLTEIFKSNQSSLTSKSRQEEGLPMLTGLHVLRYSVRGNDYALSVRSGKNYVVVLANPEASEAPRVRAIGRHRHSGGVHFFLRLASVQGRPPANWVDGIPREGLERSIPWWTRVLPQRFDRAHVVNSYQVPDRAKAEDVLICRPHQPESKTALFNFLEEVAKYEMHVIFFEVPSPLARWIFEVINLLLEQDIKLICPIVTNTYHVRLPGKHPRRAVDSLISASKSKGEYWWQRPKAPIQSIPEAARRIRQVDSQEFWSLAKETTGAFTEEPIKWSKNLTLLGGYINLPAALRSPALRKLVRKRLVCLAHGLRAGRIFPASEQLRYIASELSYSADLNPINSDRVGILASVRVTGATLKRAKTGMTQASQALSMPILIYPRSAADPPSRSKIPSGVRPRAFDWPESKRSDQEALARLSRLGESSVIRDLSTSTNQTYLGQLPAQAYAVWDRLNLLQLGHFSYGRHHYLVWLDLIKFLSFKTGEALEMLSAMTAKLRSWKPDWIFYIQHHVSDALLDRLSEHGGNELLPENRIWPISELESFRSMFAKSHQATPGVAVIIDDALVTGEHLRTTQAVLYEMGFRKVHSLVILDRTDPARALPTPTQGSSEHFSWWSLQIGPIGDESFCPICNAVGMLRYTEASATSSQIKNSIKHWLNAWSQGDHLARFRSVIETLTLESIISKPLATRDSKDTPIATTASACAWGLELSKRLDYYSYLIRNDSDFPARGKIEALSGLTLHYWDVLENALQQKLLTTIIDLLWHEERTGARTLAGLALLSVVHQSGELVLREFGKKTRQYGLPNIDVAIIGYAIVDSTSSRQIDNTAIFDSWLPSNKAQIGSRQRKKSTALINALRDTSGSSDDVLISLELLGFPGRGPGHYYLYDLLSDCAEDGAGFSTNIEEQRNLVAYLEPIRRTIDHHRVLLEGERTYKSTLNSVDSLLELLSEPPLQIDSRFEAGLQATSRDALKALFQAPAYGTRSLRAILAGHFLHYPPYLVRSRIPDATKRIEGLGANDIEIEGPDEIPPEKHILYHDPPLSELHSLERELQKHDVIFGYSVELTAAISDILMDAKHSKDYGLGFGSNDGPPYQRIRLRGVSRRPDGRLIYRLHFDARASEDQYISFRQGRSWAVVQDLIFRNQGHTALEFRAGILTKTLIFSTFSQRKGDNQ